MPAKTVWAGPTRHERDPVLRWVLSDHTATSKIAMIKAVRVTTLCSLKDAKTIVDRFYADVDHVKQNGTVADPIPEDVDIDAELADLNEMERTWMQE